MAEITIELIKRLPSLPGLELQMQSKAVETDGDFDKALESHAQKRQTKAEKRGEREARSGVIGSYVTITVSAYLLK